MLKSDFALKNSEKLQWKCPDCRTINKMDYYCTKCGKDCFHFKPPPSLANPDKKEEVQNVAEEKKVQAVAEESNPEKGSERIQQRGEGGRGRGDRGGERRGRGNGEWRGGDRPQTQGEYRGRGGYNRGPPEDNEYRGRGGYNRDPPEDNEYRGRGGYNRGPPEDN